MPFNTQPAITDLSRFDRAITQENAFIVTTDIQAIASAGGTLALTLENPSGSGITAVVQDTRVSADVEVSVELFDGFSSDPSGGTSLTIDNLLLDSGGGADPGSMNARRDDTFTASNTQDAQVLGGGQGGQTVGASGSTAKFYLEPDRSAVFQLTNGTSNDGDGAITIIFFERNEVFVGA